MFYEVFICAFKNSKQCQDTKIGICFISMYNSRNEIPVSVSVDLITEDKQIFYCPTLMQLFKDSKYVTNGS